MVILWVTFVHIKIQPLLISLPGHSVKYLEIQHFKPRVSLEDIKRFFNASKVRSFLTCKRLLCKFPLHKKKRYWIRSKWATSVKKIFTADCWNLKCSLIQCSWLQSLKCNQWPMLNGIYMQNIFSTAQNIKLQRLRQIRTNPKNRAGCVLLTVLMSANVTGESWHEAISAQWRKRHHTGPATLLFSRLI